MPRPTLVERSLIPSSPVLISESAKDFNAIRNNLIRDLKPPGIVGQMYVEDIAQLTWEIIRLHRCKSVIINLQFQEALKRVLLNLSAFDSQVNMKYKELACDWFTDGSAKKYVLDFLKQFQLDESAIEAEAVRLAFSDLEVIDRLLASAESRRNKALRCIAELRGGFATQLRQRSDEIIDGEVIAEETHKRSARA